MITNLNNTFKFINKASCSHRQMKYNMQEGVVSNGFYANRSGISHKWILQL